MFSCCKRSRRPLVNNSFAEATAIPRELIQHIRREFVHDAIVYPLLYENIDINRVATNDWAIERYILVHGGDPNLVLSALRRGIACRTTIGINDITVKMFPKVLFQAGLVRLYGRDLNDAPVMIIRANLYRETLRREWLPMYKKFLTYWAEQADKANKGEGLTVIIDGQDMDPYNYAPAMYHFLLQMLRDLYPKLFTVIVFHKMPLFYRTTVREQFWRHTLRSERKIMKWTYKSKQLLKYVSESNLPDFLKGTNTASYRIVPKGASSPQKVAKLLKLRLNDEIAFKEHYEQFIPSDMKYKKAKVYPMKDLLARYFADQAANLNRQLQTQQLQVEEDKAQVFIDDQQPGNSDSCEELIKELKNKVRDLKLPLQTSKLQVEDDKVFIDDQPPGNNDTCEELIEKLKNNVRNLKRLYGNENDVVSSVSRMGASRPKTYAEVARLAIYCNEKSKANQEPAAVMDLVPAWTAVPSTGANIGSTEAVATGATVESVHPSSMASDAKPR